MTMRELRKNLQITSCRCHAQSHNQNQRPSMCMTQRQWAPEERTCASMTSRAAGCGYGFRAMRRAAAVLSATLLRASDEATAHIVRREDPADAGGTLQKAAIGGGGEVTPLASSATRSSPAPVFASPTVFERAAVASSRKKTTPSPSPSSRWPFEGNALKQRMRTHTATAKPGAKRATIEDSMQIGHQRFGGGAGPAPGGKYLLPGHGSSALPTGDGRSLASRDDFQNRTASGSSYEKAGSGPGSYNEQTDETTLFANAGFTHYTITWADDSRSYWVYVPSGTINGLVMFFHGYKVKTSYTCLGVHKHSFQTKAMADAKGFIAVCPEGLGPQSNRGWNLGPCCGQASTAGTDDVGFVNAMLDKLSNTDLPSDTYPSQNVFAFGFSTGGAFTYRLACDLNNRIDGIAPVGATFNWAFNENNEGKMPWATTCKSSTPVWSSIGDSDKYTSACKGLTKWRSYASDVLTCSSGTESLTKVSDDVTCWGYEQCGTSRAVFCLYKDSLHEVKTLMQGADYWHTERAWDFLAAGTMPVGTSGSPPTSVSGCEESSNMGLIIGVVLAVVVLGGVGAAFATGAIGGGGGGAEGAEEEGEGAGDGVEGGEDGGQEEE